MAKPNPRKMSAAEVAAAGADTATVTWRDLHFTVPKFSRWPIDAMEALEDNKLYTALRAVLGDEQWAAFKASTPTPVQGDVEELSNLLGQAAAQVASLGESPASSDS